MTEMSPEAYVPDAVTKVARDLTAIEELSCHLAAEAEHKANDPEYLPGGNATVSLAAVANLEAWENIFESREAHGRDTSHASDEDDAWEPPLQTLTYWSEAWRREHGYELDQRPTIASEANFIRWCLAWAIENEAHWDDFARDINRARLRLEDILYAGRRVQRSRVPCIEEDCERKPRLIKIYRDEQDEDFHKCPSCKTHYPPQRYRFAKAQLLASQDANRHVKYQDALNAIDRSDRTFRKWVRLWYVRSFRDPLTGQVWVWWPDVRESDLTTPRRDRGIA